MLAGRHETSCRDLMFPVCKVVSFVFVIAFVPSHSFIHPQLRVDYSLKSLSITNTKNAPAVGNTTAADNSNMVISGDSRVAATYARAKLGKAPLDLADILITDPPYCLLNRRRTGGDLRDPKVRKKKIDDSDTVTRFENLKEYKTFTKEWLKPCIEHGLKPGAGESGDSVILHKNGSQTFQNSKSELSTFDR